MSQLRPDVIPCFSTAELQRTQIKTGLPNILSHNTSQDSVTESRIKEHQNDGLTGIPRTLNFGWWSFAADAISILGTIPFIVLGILLARAKNEVAEADALHNFENAIRVVSKSDIPICLN